MNSNDDRHRDAESPPAGPAAGDAPALRVRRMQAAEAEIVADYHREGIPGGLLAELGRPVLRTLYRSLNTGDDGFVFVAVDARDEIVGFVAGAVSVGRLYKRVLRKHFLRFTLVGLRYVLRPRMIRRILESLFYPSKVADDYPDAELLSIVVASSARGSGAAAALLRALLDEFRLRKTDKIKVMVGARLERANAFYRKHGFRPAGRIERHGQPSNIYVIDTNADDRP